jgi:hypothetical protein
MREEETIERPTLQRRFPKATRLGLRAVALFHGRLESVTRFLGSCLDRQRGVRLMDEEWIGADNNRPPRLWLSSRRRWRRRDSSRVAVKSLSHAARLALWWGLAGLLLGMVLGGMAGLWLAMVDNTLYGIGGDNYSGPISRTREQEVWVYIRWLGLGLAFVGGPLAVVCSLMGWFRGICSRVEVATSQLDH